MSRSRDIFYWDSCVCIAFLNKYDPHRSVLDAIHEDVKNSNGKKIIVASTIAKVEVAFVGGGKKKLTESDEQLIDDFWNDDEVIELIEFHGHIATLARRIVRETRAKGIKTMRPLDAVHLATAMSIPVSEFHTYNMQHFEWYNDEGEFKVCEPYVAQPKLNL